MNTDSESRVFQLFWDTEHLGDDEFDAKLVPFPGWELITGWNSTREEKIPEKIFFEADFESLRTIEYPVNDDNWPIMSKRMLDVLLSVGGFPHRAIPVIMLDDTVKASERLDAEGNPRPGVADDRFVAVQLTEHIDAFDWERSEFVPHQRLAGRVKRISKLALKEPPGGFPPLFRLSVRSLYLFVSAAARRALDEASIRGPVFWSIDKIKV